MAKKNDFGSFITSDTEVKNNFDLNEKSATTATEVPVAVEEPVKPLSKEEVKEEEEVYSGKDLNTFLNSAKFMKAFENVSLDKSSLTSVTLYKQNMDALDLLASILSDKKFGKGELLNMIVYNFFKKNGKELKEAYRLFSLSRAFTMFD